MADTLLSDHIAIFADALTPAHCETLIERFEASPDQIPQKRANGHSFTEVNVTKCWPDQHETLAAIFLSHFVAYRSAVEAHFWPPEFAFEHIRIKRYLPDGRDCFPAHVDVMGQDSAKRFMTAIIYLNAPEGGETTFPGLDLTIPPEPGKLLAFPPLWLFPHAGLPPRSGAKYIAHTYLCYAA
jgi:prolyl 4-hydroxylase